MPDPAEKLIGFAALAGMAGVVYVMAQRGQGDNVTSGQSWGDWLESLIPSGWGWGGTTSEKTDMTNSSLPRGIRNKNPGNLENNGIDWLGLSASQTDSRFYQFDQPVYGIRALARVLKNYQRLHGIHTLRGVINRWAPSHENNTSAYLRAVSNDTGISPDAPIDLTRDSTLSLVVPAIIRHENGEQPYSASLITDAINMA